MNIRATLQVNDAKLLKHYNNPKLERDVLEEVEDYVGDERPFTAIHIPQLISYHMLGEDEFVYVEVD